MLGRTRFLTELSKLVKRTRADGLSVCAHTKTHRVFRFAHEAIHQDLIQEHVRVTVKAIFRPSGDQRTPSMRASVGKPSTGCSRRSEIRFNVRLLT